jgi:hypothetical protein
MRLHRIAGCGVALASLVITAGLSAPGGAAPAPAGLERGAPGKWTQISTGSSGITYQSSLYRTADGVLHVLYPKGLGNADQLGHVALSPAGAVFGQGDVLPAPWAVVDSEPALVGTADGGLRAVFGGQQTTPGFWADGRMYTATAPTPGTPWTLPMEAVGASKSAVDSYGTAATALADGTPIAAYPLNSTITWHVGTGTGDDATFAIDGCCAYDLAMVRDGADVWLGWYSNGGTAETNGTFVRQIYPTLGPVIKAPGSSVGAASLSTGRVALVARDGGGVFAAYCVGYPDCDHVALWNVGTGKVSQVPASRYAAYIALSPGPSGRLWLSWSDNIPTVKAARTGRSGSGFTPVRTVGMPTGKTAVYNLSLEGSTGRGDIVIQVGDGFWHTQVISGLTLKAKPGAIKHGRKQKVRFTVTDAGDKVGGAKVKVGARKCTTTAGGTCTIVFPKSTKTGRLSVRASRPGYAGALIRLRVR